jgi:excisionase family DNA binding protein
MSELLTLAEVAERLRVGKRTVERMVAAGELRSLRIRRRRFVDEREVERYLGLAIRRGRVA